MESWLDVLLEQRDKTAEATGEGSTILSILGG